jgi:TRAP-type C4-dicarboxylate transport system permease large subunit
VGARLAGVGMGAVVKAMIPMMMISTSILLVVTYIPSISMALVHAAR